MASLATPTETPPALWTALSRLRNVSRLVLAAIQRNDLDSVQQLAREGDALVKCIEPILGSSSDAALAENMGSILEEVSILHRRILESLTTERDAVAQELAKVRETRGKLRAIKMPPARDESRLVDRQT